MGHPVLKAQAEPVAEPKAQEIQQLVRDMVETLEDVGGIGLAAPQVHVSKRVVIFYVPGEHDVMSDNGAMYRERFAKKSIGSGYYSFDHKGVHFVGLVNVVDTHEGGLGVLGAAQLDWLQKDLAPLPASTPIVVFAHIPLWAVYPQWGWGTDDAEQALGYLRRFGSVTVLNGHIHQTVKKVEGNITFHTAMSTAFPQPAPGTAPKVTRVLMEQRWI